MPYICYLLRIKFVILTFYGNRCFLRRRLPLKPKFKPRRRLRRNKAAQREILKIEVFQDIRINENEQFGRPTPPSPPPPRGGGKPVLF